MKRFFNTTGPCTAGRHYMLPPSQRLPEARALVERDQFLVLHAGRQVGKTTAMLAFAAELRADRRLLHILAAIRARGERQLGRYLEEMGLREGWLLVVDQRPKRSWRQRM